MAEPVLGTDEDVFDPGNKEASEQSATSESDQNWVTLPPTDLLTVEGADAFLRWRPADVIAIVGERNSGKTTLVSEIYERFLRGPFAGFGFSYSQTLLGFERKTFESRMDSMAPTPDTTRTSAAEGLRFFHLGLSLENNPSVHRDVLLSERAGEAYRAARDRPALSSDLLELRKAKTIAFVLDGERVANGMKRSEAFSSTRNMIRGFSDNGTISEGTEVQLVTSKFDLLEGQGNDAANEALSEFEERTMRSFSKRFRSLTSWRTAARDPKGHLEPAWGLAPLLQSWFAPREKVKMAPRPLPPLYGEFDHLLVRRGSIE